MMYVEKRKKSSIKVPETTPRLHYYWLYDIFSRLLYTVHLDSIQIRTGTK